MGKIGIGIGAFVAFATGCGDTMTIGESTSGGSNNQAGAGAAPVSSGGTASGGSSSVSGSGAAGEGGESGSPPEPTVTCEGTGERLFADHFATCFLREDGHPVCWGAAWAETTPDVPMVSLSVGQDAACGVTPECEVLCWGEARFTAVPTEKRALEVGIDATRACALDLDHRVYCWGFPDSGGGLDPALTIRHLIKGDGSFCGIAQAPSAPGEAHCWGSILLSARPRIELGPFIDLAPGDHSCGLLEDGTLRCWGNTYYGGTEAPEGTFASIFTEGHVSCALDDDGRAQCWGTLYYEDEDTEALLTPPDDQFTSLVTGVAHVCGLTRSGEARCWGYGVPGDPRPELPYFGQASPPDGEFVELAAGFWHTCGLRPDDRIECWGQGQPGDPGYDDVPGPSSVPDPLE